MRSLCGVFVAIAMAIRHTMAAAPPAPPATAFNGSKHNIAREKGHLLLLLLLPISAIAIQSKRTALLFRL